MGQNSSSTQKSSTTKCDVRLCKTCKLSNDWIYLNGSGQQNKSADNSTNDEFNRIDYLCNDLNVEALESIKLNKFESALRLYQYSSLKSPANGNLKINLSYCLYFMARYEESFSNARQAIDLCHISTKPKAYFRCGEALIKMKRFEDAVKHFQMVLIYKRVCETTQNRITFAKQMISREIEISRRNMNSLSVPITQDSSRISEPKPTTSQSVISEKNVNTSVTNSLDKTDRGQRNSEQSNIESKKTSKPHSNNRMTKSYSTERININPNYNRRKKFDEHHNRNKNKMHHMSQQDIHQLSKIDENKIDRSIDGWDVADIDDSIGIKFKTETEALNICTKMISLSQTDHRLYINRSFYNYSLGKYESALSDAKQAISLNPNEPKAYFRAGIALKALGNLKEAETMLFNVLKLVPDNDLVNSQLIKIRCKALRKIGYDEEISLDVALKNQTIQESYEYVLSHNLKSIQINSSEKPTNLLKLNALKVRNIASDTRLAILYSIFEKFGKVEKLYFDRPNHCCYINYTNDESPIQAISTLYGYKVEDLCHNGKSSWLFGLVPSRQQRDRFESMSKSRIKKIINDCGECDDWRRKDCPLEDRCPLKHIPINKGIETLLSRRVNK